MKYILILLVIIIAMHGSAKTIQAYLSYATFKSPTKGTYIETYLSIEGNSIKYKPLSDSLFQGGVDITQSFIQNGKVINYKKYRLNTPQISDTLSVLNEYIDQQRFLLPEGTYEYEITLNDVNTKEKAFTTTQTVSISYSTDIIEISDVQLIESLKESKKNTTLTKNGYELVPYVSNFYGESTDKMLFYAEIYNADVFLGKNEPFVYEYYIENYDTKQPVADLYRIKKIEAGQVGVILGQLPLSNVFTGNYNLIIQIKDKNNVMIASKKMFFQRSNNVLKDKTVFDKISVDDKFVNKYNHKDTLLEYVSCLRPISNEYEKEFATNLLENCDIEKLQRYFYNFWINRNPQDPEKAWLEYAKRVQEANEAFGTQIHKGYETDRGRVFLQYGAPNSVSKSDYEPGQYPYEIWHYYKVGNQTNRKFVFSSSDLVTNNLQLIHSDAIGEHYDNQWRLKLRPNGSAGTFDELDHPNIDGYGRNTERLYRNP